MLQPRHEAGAAQLITRSVDQLVQRHSKRVDLPLPSGFGSFGEITELKREHDVLRQIDKAAKAAQPLSS